ncbi:MAG: ABC-2 family transporter protein [Actinocatenispora sp.]
MVTETPQSDRPVRRRTSAANPVPWWRIYLIQLGAAFRAQLQYRGNLLLTIVSEIAFQGVGVAFVWIIVARFGAIGGWSIAEIALLYGMRLVASGLWQVPSSQLFGVSGMVRSGEFDNFLIRPAGPLLQLLSRNVYLAPVGNLITGVVILVAAASRLPVQLSLAGLVYLLLALVGGAMVEGSFQLAAAALSFRTLSTQSLRLLVDSIFDNFGGYPLNIFPRAAQFALTFVVPLAFIAYLPAGVLLDRTGGMHVTAWLAYGAPVVGPVLLGLAYLLWRTQIRHYASSGT